MLPLRLMRLYHVTDASSVEKILKGGFKPTDGDFGRGVYFWDSLEYAQRFLRSGGNWGYQSPVILEVEATSGAAKYVDSSSIHAVTMLAEVEPEEEEDLLDLWEHTLLVRTAKAYKPAIVRVIEFKQPTSGMAKGRAGRFL